MRQSYSTNISNTILKSCTCVFFFSIVFQQNTLANGFSFNQISESNKISNHSTKLIIEKGSVMHLLNPEDMNKLSQALQLKDDQRQVIVNVIKEQIPIIEQNINSLHLAHNMLMSMATNKNYDEYIANTAADQIAKSSANLGVLEAEREFKIYSILSDDQLKKLNDLQTNNIIHLM